MYPAAKVAKKLHTSRQCVYDWFSGKSRPNQAARERINDLIKELTSEHK